jgi:transposase, IS6 family
MTEQNPFKWRHFQTEIILLCVRWYLRYSLSYRDMEEMMLERGLQVDHTVLLQKLAEEHTGQEFPALVGLRPLLQTGRR